MEFTVLPVARSLENHFYPPLLFSEQKYRLVIELHEIFSFDGSHEFSENVFEQETRKSVRVATLDGQMKL